MRAHHDLYCRRCGTERKNRMVDVKELPHCPNCQTVMRVDWSHGQPPATDVRGSEQTSEVLDDADGRPLRWTSTRERDRKMRAQGFEPAGDRVHGARTTISSVPETIPSRKKVRWGVDDGTYKPAA
jgi:hypothetical protein